MEPVSPSRTFFLGETADVTLQGSPQTSKPQVAALYPFLSTLNSLLSHLQTCLHLAPDPGPPASKGEAPGLQRVTCCGPSSRANTGHPGPAHCTPGDLHEGPC